MIERPSPPRRLLFALVGITIALLFNVALGHASPVVVRLERTGATLRATATTPEGRPVPGMRLEVQVFQTSASVGRVALEESETGSYSARLELRDAEYRFALRDSTPGYAPVTAEARGAWRDRSVVEITLPPSPPSAQDIGVLLALTVAPVVLSLGVVGFILLTRPKSSVAS